MNNAAIVHMLREIVIAIDMASRSGFDREEILDASEIIKNAHEDGYDDLVQLIPATGWWAIYGDSKDSKFWTWSPLVAFGLYATGRIEAFDAECGGNTAQEPCSAEKSFRGLVYAPQKQGKEVYDPRDFGITFE